MIYELLATALLACSLGAGINKDGPKRATTTFPFLGSYELTIEHIGSGTRQGDWYTIETPLGNTAVCHNTEWDTTFSATSSDGFATLEVSQHQGGYTQPYFADIVLTIRANSEGNNERLDYSYSSMQEDQSQYVQLGEGVDINEFTSDGYLPQISLIHEWGAVGNTSAIFTFPLVYSVTWQGFAVVEYDSVSWVKAGANFSKTFNAIYEDNTEPKFYAFWLHTFMLARQVRYNGDIINANYVTGMDRLDPSFGKQVNVHFTATEDVNLKVSATPYDPSWSLTNDYNRGYNNGYEDGLEEGQTPVSWIKTTFDGIAGFFNIQVFPFVTLGFLCFAPLIVVAIIAILRIIKHE